MSEQDRSVKWFNTAFYPRHRTGRAVRYEDGVLVRLRETEVTLFTPWGPRYKWEDRGIVVKQNDKEVEVLNFLAAMLDRWQENMPGKKFRWMFLAADLYGTRINNLPKEVVVEYFMSLQAWIHEILPDAKFHLWSEFDEQAEQYRCFVRERSDTMLHYQLVHRATLVAHAMARGGDPKAYLVERIAEAMLIEHMFHPIKISCVPRGKDDNVDWDLPRLYLLPERLHAPWL